MVGAIDVSAGELPPRQPPPAPSSCPEIYQRELIPLDKVTKYDFLAKCGRPGSNGRYAGRPHLERIIHTDGTACQIEYDASVTFQDLPSYISASWSSPTGAGS